MRRPAALMTAILLVTGTAAFAAALSAGDRGYLRNNFSLAPDSTILQGLTAAEQDRLHGLINDASFRERPEALRDNVADFLFDAYMRQCSIWSLSHGSPACPPPADPRLAPGKELADRRCNACHLFGTSEAPPFFKLARDKALTEQRIADAVAHGHAMSPISLQPGEVRALFAYIGSLK